jgi:hypothetical protein
MTHGLTWQLLLRADPGQVFAALVETAVEHGRLHSLEETERGLTFIGAPGTSAQRTRLRAYVRDHAGGSLVQIGAAEARPRRPWDGQGQADEAASIGSLVHALRAQLGAVGTRIVGPVARA